MQLNALEKSMEGVMAPTDSRLRPDIRALENGDIGTLNQYETCSELVPQCTTAFADLASAEKKRLEEKQRMARKNRSKSTDEWKTRQVARSRRVALAPPRRRFNSCSPVVLSSTCTRPSVTLD